MFRALENGEEIKDSDEFLDDDKKTWVNAESCRWLTGAKYNSRMMKPFRREVN